MNRSAADALKVLVVDDHHDTAVLTTRILTSIGHYVLRAESCAKALEIVKANQIDVVVTDIAMPDGDGCDLLDDILAHYPVLGVAFTGYASTADQLRFKKAGFTHVITKPADIDAIVDAVNSAIELRRIVAT
jgi:two-component system CheB/CheR fusion protein